MDIHSLGRNTGPLSTDAVNPHADNSPTPATSASNASVQVALSPAARKLLEQEDESRDLDMKRVASIRAALAKGLIPIDASRIADSIIAVTQELLNARAEDETDHEGS